MMARTMRLPSRLARRPGKPVPWRFASRLPGRLAGQRLWPLRGAAHGSSPSSVAWPAVLPLPSLS